MGVLSEYISKEAQQLRADSELRKKDKLEWQRAVQELVERMLGWVTTSDPEGVLQYRRTKHLFEDYDIGGDYELPGVSLILGDATLRIVPNNLSVVGRIQVPGEPHTRRIDGRVEFDNSTDRIPLYCVKDGNRNVWLWWTHGGVGRPFDRESFEAAVVSLLR